MGRGHSREFQNYFCLSAIHNPRFRSYVAGKVKPEFLTEWGPQKIYEITLKLHSKQRYISFIAVEEEIKKDVSLDDKKVEELLDFLGTFKNSNETIEAMTSNVLPRVEEEVGKNILTHAIVSSQDLLDKGNYSEIFNLFARTKAMAIYQNSTELDAFDSLSKGIDKIPWKRGIPLGIVGFDEQAIVNRSVDLELYHKGLPRGAIAIFGGSAKGGKTAFKQNIAIYQALSGFNVDYYSLEMRLDYLLIRNLSMLVDIETNEIRSEENEIRSKKILEEIYDKFPDKGDIRYYNYRAHSLTISMIEQNTLYSESQGRKVDVIIVDYVDRMACERKFKEPWQEAGYNVIELRDLGEKNDCSIITSSQLDKQAYNKKLSTRENVRGAYSKIFDCDLFATLNRHKEKTAVGDVVNTYLFIDATRYGDADMFLQLEGNLRTGRMFNPIPQLS